MSLRRGVERVAIAATLIATVILSNPGVGHADVSYVYDELGRLVGVIDPSSDTAVYSYDAVGNLLSITRYASSSVSIIDVQPKSGPVGTTVTIQGTGFSATPASNTVTFNGAAANVTFATTTTLVVTVPAAATTGALGVTAPGGTGSASFTVTATNGSPTITSFSPTIGTPGTTVTISGSNFEPVRTNNKISFYGVPPAKSVASAATTTSLDVSVPPNARSGPLTVATPRGTATSSADFFVPTGGYSAAQVVFTGRIAIGGASADVSVLANTIGLVVFNGAAGQRLDLGTKLLSGAPAILVTIYRPDGVVLPTVASSSSGLARYLPPLPMTGTYVIQVTGQTLAYAVRLTLSEELQITSGVAGASVTFSTTRNGQRARLVFAGTAGERASAGVTYVPPLAPTLSMLRPDDTILVSPISIGGGAADLHSPPLPSSGAYAFIVEPANLDAATFTATLSDELTGTTAVDGASTPVAITRPGQRARITFTGTVGQQASIGITSATFSGAITVYRPDGTTIHAGPVSYSTPAAGIDLAAFPSTGTYEILIDPNAAATGSLTLWLSSPISGTSALDGSTLAVNITRPGQRALLNFTGTTGHRASHWLTSNTITGAFAILRPDGSVVQSLGLASSVFIEPYTLVNGTYLIVIDPSAANTGSTTLRSYDVPADVIGSLTINGGTTGVTLSTPGQNALLTFAGTAGQNITVRVTSNSYGCGSVSIVAPGGGGIGSTNTCAVNFNVTASVTTTGTHTVKINPTDGASGSVTVEVTVP